MKEVTRVHLAKTTYDIEVDAKKALEKYLASIEKTMNDEDVMVEIEARMVELLMERGVASGGVITSGDVEALRAQMGESKEFSEDGKTSKDSEDVSTMQIQKRLMRDSDNAILGGVCSGLAAYFGVDAVWVRIAASLLLVVSFGTGVLLYLLLWIIMPEAKTAADKLQMRGEPVTLESLRNFSVSEDLNRGFVRGHNVSDMVKRVLSISFGILMLLIMAGGLLALAIGTWVGWSLVGLLEGLNVLPYAIGTLISLMVGGAAFVILCGLLAQMSFARKARKIAVVFAITALIVGTFAASMVGIFAMQSVVAFDQDEKRLSKTISVDLPDMTGVKDVISDDEVAIFSVEINPSDGPGRVELQYYDLYGKKPEVKFERRGDILYVKVEGIENEENCSIGRGWLLGVRNGSLCRILGPVQLRIYSPAADLSVNSLSAVSE